MARHSDGCRPYLALGGRAAFACIRPININGQN